MFYTGKCVMDSDSMQWATALKSKIEAQMLGIGIVYYPHNYMASSQNIFDSNLKFFLKESDISYHHTKIGVDYYHQNFFEVIKQIGTVSDLTVVTGFEDCKLLSSSILRETFRMELLYEIRDNIEMFGVANANFFMNDMELTPELFFEEYNFQYSEFKQLVDNYSFFKYSLIEQKELLFRNLHADFQTQAFKLGATITLQQLNYKPWTKTKPTLIILPDYLLSFMIALEPTNGLYSLAKSQLGVQGFDEHNHFINTFVPPKGLRYPNPAAVYNLFNSLLDEFSN